MSAAPQVDPIEVASRDEITALQTEWLRRTLRRACDNVAGYTQQDIDFWADLMARSIRASGDRHQRYGVSIESIFVPLTR